MTKKRILIVDDDAEATSLLKAKLDQTGAYEVRTENRGTRGPAATREFKPDLVLLDVDMPDADGGEVAFRIQADKTVSHTPILFLTSMVSETETGAAGLSSGGHHFLAKPVDFPRLLEHIETILADQAKPRAHTST